MRRLESSFANKVYPGWFAYVHLENKHFSSCEDKNCENHIIVFAILANSYAWGIKIFLAFSGLNELTEVVVIDSPVFSIKHCYYEVTGQMFQAFIAVQLVWQKHCLL